jgi:hypothetical protein
MSCKPYFRERSSRQIVGLEGASGAADVTASLACEEHGTSMGRGCDRCRRNGIKFVVSWKTTKRTGSGIEQLRRTV